MAEQYSLPEISKEILNYARSTLVVKLRFLAPAITALKLEEGETEFITTDSGSIYYNPKYVALMFKYAPELPTRCFLHLLMHCIYMHSFVNPLLDQRCWNLACDIAVENSINEFELECVNIDRVQDQKQVVEKIKEETTLVTAEKIYGWLINSKLSESEFSRWEELFRIDEHSKWYEEEAEDGGDGENGENGEGSGNGEKGKSSSEKKYGSGARSELADMWKKLSGNIQTDLETFSKQKGDMAGSLMQNLKALNRERYDYTAFLKKFSVMGEAMKINDDEFDYIFYTYGLNMYPEHKMPLIEPLEYKEVKRIKEFVIAIDTSGSVFGETVQKFVQKTYNILKQSESFFTKINIHIIQCDTVIQDDAKITSQEEFDEYLKTMKLCGCGGTDFRPVFEYVDNLILKKEFTNLKGLIYFTDGYGDFPARKPGYETAFVFLDDEYNNPEVPAWAIKLVLQSNEI